MKRGFLRQFHSPHLDTFDFRTEHIGPMATVKDQENTFPVRGKFVGEIPDWFRPGMTGIAKI